MLKTYFPIDSGQKDLATQWKVVIEDGVRVKFISARQGGLVNVLVGNDDLKLGDWNVLDLVLFRQAIWLVEAARGCYS